MRKRQVQRQVQSARDAGAAVTVDWRGDAAPISDTELSASRPRAPDVIPQAWLDRLLLATVDLPLATEGERSVVESMLKCVASLLAPHAVGACLAEADPGGDGRIIFRGQTKGLVEGPVGTNPTRLFPEFKYEYVAPVMGATHPGPTLHIASDDDDFDPQASPGVQLLDRAATVLSRALPRVRAASVVNASGRGNTRAIERRMMQADKLATFGQLAAGVVHELNNPLTSIVAYSDYLIRKVADGTSGQDPEDIERLRRISESANRMLRFTRELVGYARPSSGAVGTVALHRAIDQAIAFCEHVLSASGVDVERRYVAGPLDIQGVQEQLVQVFVNLVTNACQAAPQSGGRIVVTTARQEGSPGRVVVTVDDNGSGIAPENLQHLFVPFFTTKRNSHGTGLGLSISKNIVGGHDGTIRVESELGRGTRFVIELLPSNLDVKS